MVEEWGRSSNSPFLGIAFHGHFADVLNLDSYLHNPAKRTGGRGELRVEYLQTRDAALVQLDLTGGFRNVAGLIPRANVVGLVAVRQKPASILGAVPFKWL